ncbi:MAG TPA: YqiA/YcfP family alpha/beta fold hydrolase [Burkholderiaceae bacterium]|nr:YqiA/YcfP family alpha/beta fold hydrolase [Burkholderiaceae bacterium]
MILYLHGFRSSPQSFKARMIAERLEVLGCGKEYQCPQLPASPRAAIALCMQLAIQVPSNNLTLIGSSLGGYYATWIAEQTGCRAVLLNPAIHPARDLKNHVGEMTAYHSDARFEFKNEYLEELEALRVASITMPDRYLLIAATGDEVLDWREMVEHYPYAAHRVINGGDHGLSNFSCYVDEVMAFCGVDV